MQCWTAALEEPRTLTSSLWLSSRCSHPGSSRRDCPQGRSTREHWPRRWRTRCSPAPHRPPGKRPAGGGNRCASAPPQPRHTAHLGPSRGTHLGLDPGKKQLEQQRTMLKKTHKAMLFSYAFFVVFFPHFGANTWFFWLKWRKSSMPACDRDRSNQFLLQAKAVGLCCSVLRVAGTQLKHDSLEALMEN